MLRFVITCDESPGILSKIVVAIRRSSDGVANQNVTDSGGVRVVEIDFKASKQEAQLLYNLLIKTPGIHTIKAFSVKSKPAAQDGIAGNYNHESVTARVNSVFPNVASLILDIRSQLAPEAIAEELFQIGVDVAAQRANGGLLTIAEQSSHLPDIIRETILPEMALFGKAEYVEEGYETGLMIMSSIFTKPKAGERSSEIGNTFGSLESDAIRCDFLSGYIAGAVNVVAAAKGKSFNVSETRCRNEGHPYCLFEFD